MTLLVLQAMCRIALRIHEYCYLQNLLLGEIYRMSAKNEICIFNSRI